MQPCIVNKYGISLAATKPNNYIDFYNLCLIWRGQILKVFSELNQNTDTMTSMTIRNGIISLIIHKCYKCESKSRTYISGYFKKQRVLYTLQTTHLIFSQFLDLWELPTWEWNQSSLFIRADHYKSYVAVEETTAIPWIVTWTGISWVSGLSGT